MRWTYPVVKDSRNRPVVLDVHDGDTVRLLLDAGCEAGVFPWLRVKDVYCDEMAEDGGEMARLFTEETLFRAQSIVVHIYSRSFARWVADVVVDGRSLAEILISAGYGAATRGGPYGPEA